MNGQGLNRAFSTTGYSLALAALCSLTLSPGLAAAAEADADETGADSSVAVTSTQANNAPTASKKDETVYVFANADGSVRSTEVSVKLTNADKAEQLADVSSLSGIENVEGGQGYSGTGSNMVWDAEGEDIYYRGSTSASAPIGVSVTYRYNGSVIAPEELAGKTGKVTIRYEYSNNLKTAADVNGAQEEVYTPFIVMTGMLLDNAKFSNVQVENGRIMDDGDRTIVAGYALPGLQESLGLESDEVEVPSYFEVTADVEDFELKQTLTIATAVGLDDLNLDDLDLGDLSEVGDELSSAMSQLQDGSSELLAGLGQLAGGASSAHDGSSQLAAGANQLASGADTLSGGIGELKEKAAALPGSVKLLDDGANALKNGIYALVYGSTAADGTYTPGLISVSQSAATLAQGADKVHKGAQQLAESLQAAQAGAHQIATLLEPQTLSQLSTLFGAAGKEAKAYSNGIVTIKTGAESVSTNAATANEAVDAASRSLENMNKDGMTPDQIAAINSAKGSLEAAQTAFDSVKTGADVLASGASELSTTPTYLDQASNAATGLSEASAGLQSIATGLDQAVAALGSDEDANTLVGGAAAVANGSSQLAGGLSTMATVTEQSVYGGAVQLAGGLDTLNASAPALVDGVNQLAAGAGTLASGSWSVASNLHTLDNGLLQLLDGTKSAEDGAAQLADGIRKFNDEAISKIVELLNGDAVQAVDRFDALRDAGRAYTNFSGITAGTTGSVKFVFETDGIS